MKQHKPIICSRCDKPLADGEQLVLNPADGLIDDSPDARERYKVYAETYCVCEKGPRSEFTSSTQPPRLEEIEKRMK